jgi:hypothetical protein
MTNDKDSEDALTIAYLLGVKHGRAEQNTQTDALKIALWHLERIRDVEDIDPVWAAMSALAAIDAALKGETK